MRDLERKRAYDRQRMSRLYSESKTWWQQWPDARPWYDSLRMRPAKFQRYAADDPEYDWPGIVAKHNAEVRGWIHALVERWRNEAA